MSLLSRLFSKKKTEPLELPPEFQQDNPPDWLLDLKGAGLPHGGAFSVRVQLWQGARIASADILLLPEKEGAAPRNTSAELISSEVDRLLVLLGFSFPDQIESVPSDAKDGIPVTLSLYRQEPYCEIISTCNLADWIDTRKSRPPAVEIGLVLLDIQQRTLPA